MERRTFLAVAGASTVAVTAGCLGDDTTDDPESVVEEYYEVTDAVEDQDDIDDAIDDIQELTHSLSPLLDFLEEGQEEEEDIDDVSIDSVETEITDEDLDEEQLQERGVEFFLEDDEIEEIANQDNAVVEATVEQSGADVEEDEVTQEWIVASEDGDWLIVF